MADKDKSPDWLDDFEQLADRILGQQSTSSCDQVHPIIKRWYDEKMQNEPPSSRASVVQAISCLATEIVNDMPEVIYQAMEEHLDDDDVALWVQEVLLIGRALERGLQAGELDDL